LDFAFPALSLEVLLAADVEHTGDEVARDGLDLGVELTDIWRL